MAGGEACQDRNRMRRPGRERGRVGAMSIRRPPIPGWTVTVIRWRLMPS